MNVSSAFGEGRILKYDMKIDQNADPRSFVKALPDLKIYHYTAREVERIPKNRRVILDIDLDYFACRDSILNHLDYELEITPGQFLRKEVFLRDETLKFAGLTFSFVEKNDRYFVQVSHKKGKEQSHLPSREEITAEIDALITTLKARNTRPTVVTLCRSCRSGYCPKEYAEFIESALIQRLPVLLNH